MAGATKSAKRVLAYFLMPNIPNIDGENTREVLINIHQLISGDVESVALNLRGGLHRHLTMTMTAEGYMEQTSFAFFPSHNPGDYPHSMRERPRTSAWDWKVLTKPSAVLKVHHRGRRLKRVYCHSGGTSISVPTGGSAHRVQIGVLNYHTAESICQIGAIDEIDLK